MALAMKIVNLQLNLRELWRLLRTVMVQLDLQKKRLGTKEPPKTAAAMRKSQKAKQKENIEQKMLALLSEDRDKEEDEIELAFASIAKRAKVELTQKSKYKFIDAVNALYAKYSSGEAMAPPAPKPTQGPD